MPELEQLATLAREAEFRGDSTEELRLWRQAMELAPRGSEEFEIINARVQALSARVDTGRAPVQPHPSWVKKFGPLGPILLLVWKFKTFLLLALSKGKLLLFGLGKFSTFGSMLLSVLAYTAAYGWRFAVGIVVSIYVHEMGHVWALRKFGFAASPPMFIPFIGAVVRMKQHPANPVEDARVGLAGPIWGTAFAIGTLLFYILTDEQAIGAIAHFAAWINLFNLLPVWQLDGARGFKALSKQQRILIVVLMVAIGFFLGESFLYILAALGAVKIFSGEAPENGDAKTMMEFCGLLIVLAMLMAVPIHRPYGVRQI
jgi:Zn-dependent protease